jgi:hypothetical protein
MARAWRTEWSSVAPVLMGLADAAVFDEFVSISGFVVIIIWSV